MLSDYRRIAIILCYDRDGVIDDYVLYLLNDLKENLTDLVVVINGELSVSGKERLQTVTDKIYIRENKGADAGAWKDAMCDYLGWGKIAAYDEIVLLNDSFYGPFYPFREVFAEMNGKDLDFWGLLAHGEADISLDGCPYPHLPEHIQSYFIAIRKRMHTSPEFKKYWEELPYFATVQEAISKHETVFTKHFSDLGFTWGVLTDTHYLDGKFPEGSPTAYCFLNTYELIRNRRFPILKRHCFGFSYQNHLMSSHGMHLRQSVEYIAAETNYNLSMIYKNIIRLYNVADIFYNLQLNFVLPKSCRTAIKGKRYRVALVCHIEYESSLSFFKNYLSALPDYVAIIITLGKGVKKESVDTQYSDLTGRLKVLPSFGTGQDIASFLYTAAPYLKEYEFIGFCHDAKSNKEEVVTVGASVQELMAENVMGSRAYVEHVLELFEQHQELGLLCVPPPRHARYSIDFINPWKEDFKMVKQLVERMKLKANVAEDHIPLMTETAFWCRREAILPLLQPSGEDAGVLTESWFKDKKTVRALRKVFPFVAQHQGYLTGWVMSDDYARTVVNNDTYILNSFMNNVDLKENFSYKFILFAILKERLPGPLVEPARMIKHLLGW